MSENFSLGNVAQRTNSERQLEVKILNVLNAGGGSGAVSQIVAGTNVNVSPAGGTGAVTVNSTASGGGLTGVGSPQSSVTAAAGTTYLDTAANNFWVKGSGAGNTGWIEVVGN